jgi:ABC-type multidrug transport system fused ATPase/permease subunit
VIQNAKKTYLKIGASFGLAQCSQYMVFAAMFYFGGKIINDSIDETTGLPDTDPEKVFISIFAIMFGASAAGSASSYGPEMGKAKAAAEKIFKIIEHPSSINAVEMNEDKSKVSINSDEINGHIEFKDVWFRYPTRK